MSVRGIGDAYAFQRLLWLLVGTVVLPTALLTIYGVAAIRNQRAALVQRIQEERGARIRWAAGALFREIHRVDEAVHGAVAGCAPAPSVSCVSRVSGVSEAWVWSRDAAPPAELASAGIVAPLLGETTWLVPTAGAAPVGAFASGDAAVAWRLDVDRLTGLLAEIDRDDPHEGRFALVRLEPGPTSSVDEMIARWQQPAYAVHLPLDRPLATFALGLDFAGGDPVVDLLDRDSTLWMLGLVALVGTVLVGTVITLRSASREIRLSRLQTDFVSHLSHELRTPLTSIRMFVETLQSGRLQDPERVRECLHLLSQESDRLSRRIERVLEWGRMEAGRRIYEIEDVSVRAVVDDALAALRSQTMHDENALELAVELPSELPDLRVDRDAVTEALLNLLQNAVKHTPAPRRVVITAARRKDRVGIAVEDNGPGIPRWERKRIFEKFYQADALLSRAAEGSGLGLAIVRAIVLGHRGRVELWSEVGRGSRFTLWLPVA